MVAGLALELRVQEVDDEHQPPACENPAGRRSAVPVAAGVYTRTHTSTHSAYSKYSGVAFSVLCSAM